MHLAIDATNIRQGGGVTHLSQLLLAGNPVSAGFDRVTVWTSSVTARTLPDRSWLTVRTAPWMEGGLIGRIVGQQFRLRRDLIAAGCDVLFCPGGTLPVNCPVPAVAMCQNMLPFEPQEAARFGRFSLMRLKMRILRYTQGSSFLRANGVIFLTKYAQALVTEKLRGMIGQAALIPHGIAPRFLLAPRPQPSYAEFSAQQPFRILYVSILMPYKHQMELAQAASALRAEGLPLEVRFIGASWGKYGRRFKALLNKLDPARAFLLWSGAEPFDALHDFYSRADIFVFASSCENLPNIMIEAMASGLPVASSNRGPMPEVLGDAGIYFDPENSVSIAEAIRSFALDASLRTRMAGLAWHKAQAYSWERCADESFSFIAQVVRQQKK